MKNAGPRMLKMAAFTAAVFLMYFAVLAAGMAAGVGVSDCRAGL